MAEKPAGFLGAGTLFLLAFCISLPGQAQTLSDLDRLIFEPVPLIGDQAPAPPAQPASRSPDFTTAAAPPAAAQRLPAEASALAAVAGNELVQTSMPVRASPFLYLDGREAEDPASTRLLKADAKDSLDLYEEEIRQIAMQKGPYAIELADKLMALGELHQARAEHPQALDAFARAEHVMRVNHGLYSLTQVDSIGQTIESLVAMGDMQGAEDKYRYMLYLHERVYGEDDVRTVPALQEWGRWSMNAFRDGVRFEAEGMLIPPGPYGGGGSERSVRQAAFVKIYQAQDAFLDAIDVLVENEEFRHPDLIPLERKLIETYFLQAHRYSILEEPENYLNLDGVSTGSLIRRGMGRSGNAYRDGKEAYGRILTYLVNNPDTAPEEYARTLMEFGDWYLLFGRRVLAQRKYQEARDALQNSKLPPAAVEALLRPQVPVTAPVFTARPHTREIFLRDPNEPLEYRGWIDVAFELNQYGGARRIEVLDASEGTAGSVERRLTRLIRQSQFRPRFLDGEIANDDPVRLRYFYTW